MDKATENRLTAAEVLKETYKILRKKFSAKEVVFSEPACRVIEGGWDPCRGTDYVRFGYEKVAVIKRSDAVFLMGCGELKNNAELIGIRIDAREANNQKRLREIIHEVSSCDNRLISANQKIIKTRVSAFGYSGDIVIDNENPMEMLKCKSETREIVRNVLSRHFKLPPEFIQVEMEINLGIKKKRDSLQALTHDSTVPEAIAKYFEFQLIGYVSGCKDPD